MKSKPLFQLGMEYENFEFHVEPIKDRVFGYDSYSYMNDYKILGVNVSNVELVFSLDILVAIILEFKPPELCTKVRKYLLNYKMANNYFYIAEKEIERKLIESFF